jgi:cysteine desulfurase
MKPIYLDYNATTPVDPAVADVICSAVRDLWGNPSSSHGYGKAAHAAVETARGQVAALIGAKPGEVVFTGGGSEASNLAIKGTCLRPLPRFRWSAIWSSLFARGVSPDQVRVVTSAVEHPATAVPVEFLRRLGASVTVLKVDRHGLIDPDDVRRAVRFRFGGPTLVTLMHSNNETGTLLPIREVGELKKRYGFVFHTDCAQSLGKVPVDVTELNVDLLTVAGHKLYAPKGVGALYVRGGVDLEPLVHGAGHEGGRRAGTENTPYLVGLGKGAEVCRESLPVAGDRLLSLRDRLHQKLKDRLGDRITLNGHPTLRLPNTLNVNFAGQIGPKLLERVPRIAASVGAACHEPKPGQLEVTPSAVLCAMRVPPEVSRGAVRLTVGRWTTEAEVDEAAELLGNAIAWEKM